MRCSKCRAENPEGKKFCGDCGAALGNRCPQCGEEGPLGKRFCGNCGATLPAETTKAAPVAPSSTGTQATAERSSSIAPNDGERRHLSVLFCDLVGSTEIASHLDPEDWHDINANYQRSARAAVERFGGHVSNYLGDGLMVYFGWPEAHEDDAARAIRAGLAIVKEVAALNE